MNVIIAAAGWKGAGRSFGLTGCPEPFLPLGNGTTTLSRTAKVFIDNGYNVYIAIGERGYPYSSYIRWSATPTMPRFENEFDWSASPWTQERYDYAAQFGQVLEMPDPGGWTLSLDTFCESMDMIGKKNWDHLFLCAGDMVISPACYQAMLGFKIPFVLSFTAFHSYFGLDSESAQFFREYSEPFRRFKDERAWYMEKNWAPNHWGVVKLRDAGFNVYGREIMPWHKWTDIDVGLTYQDAIKLVAGGIG